VIKWPVFFTFFSKSKNMTFYVFLSCCTPFLEHCLCLSVYGDNDLMSPLLARLTNLSFAAGVFAETYKVRRVVVPRLKKPVTVHRCLNGLAQAYLTELCTPITQSRSSCHLRSSYCNKLAVPSVKLSTGSRSFSVSGPTVWYALPDYLRNPTLSVDVFKHYLKTVLFAQY